MVSCSGFGLPLHAQLLRLFVTMPGVHYEIKPGALYDDSRDTSHGSTNNLLLLSQIYTCGFMRLQPSREYDQMTRRRGVQTSDQYC